jgi:Transposase IS66 family
MVIVRQLVELVQNRGICETRGNGMRLQLILPRVDPAEITPPSCCPYCGGRYIQLRQAVSKPLRDTAYAQVNAHRYGCLKCGATWRVYPTGVSRDHVSQRVKGLAVMLYLLGLSYGAAALALEALGVSLSKSQVYAVVQATAERVPGMQREVVFDALHTPALGSDVTSVRCHGQWLPLGLCVDDTNGLVLTVDALSGEDSDVLANWLTPIAQAVGAELLVSDDADAFKQVAERLALQHQVCKSHVLRNTDTLIESLTPAAKQDTDGSLRALKVEPEQAVADLQQLHTWVRTRLPETETELEQLFYRYAQADAPRPGEHASLAYRLRLLFLDRWNLWARLTRYRTWCGPQGQTIDGTNNGCERSIGWWIKERYRTMRGYKRVQSAINISRLLAWCGNYLEHGGANLATLIA